MGQRDSLVIGCSEGSGRDLSGNLTPSIIWGTLDEAKDTGGRGCRRRRRSPGGGTKCLHLKGKNRRRLVGHRGAYLLM